MKEKSKIILAFIINFVIIGSGFVVLKGNKGIKIAFAYLIPFIVLSIFFIPEKNILISNLSLIGRILIYIICYIHLYKVSKKVTL